jgi:predicted acyltransferase
MIHLRVGQQTWGPRILELAPWASRGHFLAKEILGLVQEVICSTRVTQVWHLQTHLYSTMDFLRQVEILSTVPVQVVVQAILLHPEDNSQEAPAIFRRATSLYPTGMILARNRVPYLPTSLVR